LAHDEDAKEKAERLYVEEGLPVAEIAAKISIPAQTIYRWLAAARGGY